jgi:hypothetical protein
MAPGDPLTPRAKPWTTFWVVSLCTFQTSLSMSIMYVAFPDLRASFPDVSDAQLSWVLNLYTVVAASSMIIAGATGGDAAGSWSSARWASPAPPRSAPSPPDRAS